MKKITMPQCEIPVFDDVDVLVLGAGPAGFSAAVCAARQGAKTMLVEQSGDVGGMATIGLMSHWTGNTARGFYEEILNRSEVPSRGMNAPAGFIPPRFRINPERLKTVMLEMLEEAGVRLQLYTFACEAMVEDGRVTGVVIQSKAGRQAVLCKVAVDASGDGDIAASAGAPFFKGRETDGAMQPATIMFKVAGVDTTKAVFPPGFEHTFALPKGDLQTLGRKHLPFPAGHVLLYETTLPGVVTCNMTNSTGIDGTNPQDLTRATLACRKQMDAIVSFLREFVPGFEACHIISSASFIGVRETRHFIGEATLTEDDILNARVFEDWAVTKAHFGFDVHNMSGSGLDATGLTGGFPQPKFYTIPYGCLVPKKVDGLLLAGRCISGSHLAHSSFRVMPICANLGQSAGIAAAMCAGRGIMPRALNVKELQGELRKQGVEP